ALESAKLVPWWIPP
uniref:Chaperone, TCP1-related n=1 Tax=Avena sativa TaxID=4498 RepID=Q7M1G7_AVESA